ncbi:MAG: LytR/AlgR family response regulator transcription factor [Crocinitomicaceae bacterium]
MNLIIIEDEPLIAEALRFEIKRTRPNIQIECVLGSIGEALSYFKKNAMPDIFFSDIQLPDGLSFEIFKKINSKVPVVFCTAYDNYALGAFEANGVDYLLKPFTHEDIQRTFEKLEALSSPKQDLGLIEEIYLKAKPKSLIVRKGDKIIPIKSTDIQLVHIESGVTYLYSKSQGKFHVDQTIEELQAFLGEQFFRVNRQNLLSRDVVESASEYFGRKLLVKTTKDYPFELIVSKNNVTKFLGWLANS